MKLNITIKTTLVILVMAFNINSADSSGKLDESVQNKVSGKSENMIESKLRKNFVGNIKEVAWFNEKNIESSVVYKGKKPKTIKEFFMLLPEKFFSIECCESKAEYLKRYLTLEDNKNGYLEGGGDGAQNTFKMVLFKRPDKTYIIGFNSSGEAEDSFYFLEYKDDEWFDISTDVVPQYSKKNIYEFPRYGTTIEVFAKKVIDTDGEFEITEKGEKLYDLKWSNGKFSIKK